MRTSVTLAAAVLVLAATAAHGQQLRVVVRDSASGIPVSGAVIQFLSAGDSTIARAVTGLGGAASLDADSGAADVRRVRVGKIGFRPVRRTVMSLDDVVEISLVRLPVGLPPIRVSGLSACPRDDAYTRLAAVMWGEERGALVAAFGTREDHPTNTSLLRYTRDGTSTLEWVRQMVNVSSASQSFATARAQLELFLASVIPNGYVLPDEDVLLNESFVNTHCFTIRAGEGIHARETGIAFEPSRAADAAVDVQGVLWIDQTHGALRSIEFQYSRPVVPMRDVAGGSATFERVSDGVSTVTRWWLGVPPSEEVPVVPVGPRQRRTATIVAVPYHGQTRESRRLATDLITEVGEAALASWDTTTTWIGTISLVSGSVISRETRQSLAGIPVTLTTLVDPPYTVISDSAGHFELRNVFERPYMLKAADTTLADYRPRYFVPATRFAGVQAPRSMISLAPPSDATPIQVDRGVNPVVTIEIPSVEQAFRDACGRDGRGDSAGVIAGRVTSAWDPPDDAPRATVTARWTSEGRGVVREARADSLGFFRVCGVPRGRAVGLTAVRDRASSAEIRVVTGEQLMTPVSIRLRTPPPEQRF